jgi:hypothetical protein
MTSKAVEYDHLSPVTTDGFWCSTCRTSVSLPHEHMPWSHHINAHRNCSSCGAHPWQSHRQECARMSGVKQFTDVRLEFAGRSDLWRSVETFKVEMSMEDHRRHSALLRALGGADRTWYTKW